MCVKHKKEKIQKHYSWNILLIKAMFDLEDLFLVRVKEKNEHCLQNKKSVRKLQAMNESVKCMSSVLYYPCKVNSWQVKHV